MRHRCRPDRECGIRRVAVLAVGAVCAAGLVSCSALPGHDGLSSPPSAEPGPAPTPSLSRPLPAGAIPIDDDSALPVVAGDTGAPTVAWRLIRVDAQDDRVYLAAAEGPGCVIPWKVRLTSSPQTIGITVVGMAERPPCTAQKLTLVGYVAVPGGIRGRAVTHG